MELLTLALRKKKLEHRPILADRPQAVRKRKGYGPVEMLADALYGYDPHFVRALGLSHAVYSGLIYRPNSALYILP